MNKVALAVCAAVIIVVIILIITTSTEGFFYPTKMIEVEPVPHYRTIIDFNTGNRAENFIQLERFVDMDQLNDTQTTDYADANRFGGDDNGDDSNDIFTNSTSPVSNNIQLKSLVRQCDDSNGYLGGMGFQSMPIQNDLRHSGQIIDAGNIRPAFLFPHRPFGPQMGN